tara:strand:+ start:703 stop:981 length:279 start_codon:yes stop_codon:yes gene_type:complete
MAWGEMGFECATNITVTYVVDFYLKSIILEMNIKNPLNFMKLQREEYDLIYDSFKYMEFKMSSEQKKMAEQILEWAFYADNEPTESIHQPVE